MTKDADELKIRFFSRVDKTPSCWIWKASKTKNGYGNTTVNGKSRLSHRVAWELANGTIPSGMFICHVCDVKNCFNPSHLFMGTPKDNAQDRDKKGRNAHSKGTAKLVMGETVKNSKLTNAMVLEIRSYKYYKGL
jgi:hypothetical protein